MKRVTKALWLALFGATTLPSLNATSGLTSAPLLISSTRPSSSLMLKARLGCQGDRI